MCNHLEEREYVWEHIGYKLHPVYMSSHGNLKLLYNPVEQQFIVILLQAVTQKQTVNLDFCHNFMWS